MHCPGCEPNSVQRQIEEHDKKRIKKWKEKGEQEGYLPVEGPSKEIVICAAVKTITGEIFRGHRHADCFLAIRNAGRKIDSSADAQGFITSSNRFVTRLEGRKLQDAAGIPSVAEDGYQGNTLYSEDLY